MDLFFFGKYTNTPSADQSTSLSALTDNDLQIGMGSPDNTGSSVNFTSDNMKHINALALITLMSGDITTHYLSTDNTYTFSNTQTMKATNSFSGNVPYLKSADTYLSIVKPKSATTFKSANIVLGEWDAVSITPKTEDAIVPVSVYPSTKQPYFLKLGDVYYSDGAITHNEENLANGKTPIGIVGYIGSNYWTEKGTKSNDVGGHALVMGLKTIGSTSATDYGNWYQWKTSNTDDGRKKIDTSALVIGSSTQQYGSGYLESIALNDVYHPAIQAAINYISVSAPSSSTGWFLPTAGQYFAVMSAFGGYPSSDWEIMDFVPNMISVTTIINNALIKAGSNNYTDFCQGTNIWEYTSSEHSYKDAMLIDSGVDENKGAGSVRFGPSFTKTRTNPIRPFLAF